MSLKKGKNVGVPLRVSLVPGLPYLPCKHVFKKKEEMWECPRGLPLCQGNPTCLVNMSLKKRKKCGSAPEGKPSARVTLSVL